jgi:hypothetical protein
MNRLNMSDRAVEVSAVRQFRGRRQFVINLIAVVFGLLLFLVLGISVASDPPSSGHAGEFGGLVVVFVVVLLLLAVLVRLRTACTVEIRGETLVYRTLLRSIRFNRSDIAGIALSERNRGASKTLQPYLTMKDGRTVWLADMGQGKIIAPTSSMQKDLMEAVTLWIS